MCTALDTIEVIAQNDFLPTSLRYCFVKKDKVPYCGTLPARPNHQEDFLPLDELDLALAEDFAGVGISIQASNICAIDLDHCFTVPFDFNSIDERGKDVFNLFKEKTYIEFSFSGTGMRVLFLADEVEDYSKIYYTKNSKVQCEYYHPKGSARYVTITGRNISTNSIKQVDDETFYAFLEKYMKKPVRKKVEVEEREDVEDYSQLLLHFLRSDVHFQDNWFTKAPGSGKDESERDFFLVKFIFENITTNKTKIKEIFETSPFFKSKDYKHREKWNRNDGWYFNYLYDNVRGI